ncbi:MAG: substrate-binding domain-containing protein [Treponemataceae bacterium]|nr:substrate-binding domain-containing protein [Treponemataceae bacterium]
MKKFKMILAAVMVLPFFLAGCSPKTPNILNRSKAVVFYNRQPMDFDTQNADLSALNWNKRSCYVGSDPKGGELQGEMIVNYLKNSNLRKLDRNGDGFLGYVLCIGDSSHIDSINRTTGVRQKLNTWNGSASPTIKKEGGIKQPNGKTFKIVELAAREMTGSDGTPWNAEAAKSAMNDWINAFGTAIDFVVCNNDGMALSCITAAGFDSQIPVFGFDALPQTLDAIEEGLISGTISQNTDSQAAALCQLLRNFMEGDTLEEAKVLGFSQRDSYGNQLSSVCRFDEQTHSFYAASKIVTKENLDEFRKNQHEPGIKQIVCDEKKVLLTVFDANNTFLKNDYMQALNYYGKLLNIDFTIVAGDGQNEQSCLNKFTKLDNYDGFAINLVKTTNASLYTDKLKE